MRIRIAAPDTASADSLVQRLTRIDEAAAVRLDGGWAEVNLGVGAHTDRLINRVLRAVESWLEDDGVDSAEVRLEDRSHVMARSASSTLQAAS